MQLSARRYPRFDFCRSYGPDYFNHELNSSPSLSVERTSIRNWPIGQNKRVRALPHCRPKLLSDEWHERVDRDQDLGEYPSCHSARLLRTALIRLTLP